MAYNADFEGTLEEYQQLDDNQFAQEWRARYMLQRAQMLPDVARWLNVLRYFHPTRLEDHWHDINGNPLAKLYKSEGLSVEIYNFCRPIIEVYGSLLAGQKPLPFSLDIPPINPDDDIDRFMADAQEKVLMDELFAQKFPLHFMDFAVSTVLFGIGYMCSWLDAKSGRLRSQTFSWPGDVLPQWGSDRYGAGSDGMESVILAERLTLDAARRTYGDAKFVISNNMPLNFDGSPVLNEPQIGMGSVLILKIWWRWNDANGDEKIGYAAVAFDATASGESEVLYRQDDSGYPDIPVRWASRFNTPTKSPHQAAGVLDDIVGINTEYNEKLSALADMLLKLVFPKYVAKGFTSANVPRLGRDSNMYAVGLQQDIKALIEQINNVPFETFLSRLETMMFTISGLSRLMMGSMPPGDTSGEALSNLLHAAIGRLEGVRTPIQWAMTSMFDEIWVPMIRDYYKLSSKDINTGQASSHTLTEIFGRFNRSQFIWPDVTPRDALRTAELAMNLYKAKGISREGMMGRAQIPSVIDEIERMRKEMVDPVLNPQDVMLTAQAKQAQISVQMAQQQQQQEAMMIQQQGQRLQFGAPGGGAGGMGATGTPPTPQQQMGNASAMDAGRKQAAQATPTLNPANNQPKPGASDNAKSGAAAAQGR